MVKHDYEMKISKLAISVAVSISVSIFSVSTNANGLQSEMDNLFQGMSNATLPGVYESQRRGVIAGGRVTAKTKIIDENLVSFAPPSWKAGCGGVDMFGGSLSFVNADQIVQLMRAVAANAKGYAFQLALDTAFPSGAKWIENFQKKLFENYSFLNIKGEDQNLLEIFKNSIKLNPPAASGECAAPKMLQFALKNKLKPISLAEFWWGNNLKGKQRKHKEFYPSCKNKCRPILEYMLDNEELYNFAQSNLKVNKVFIHKN